MSCQEVKELIHGYLDGELDLVRSLEIEQHLKECPACLRVYQEQQALHSAIAGSDLYFEAPRSLRRGIRSAVREASRAEAPRSVLWPWPWYTFWVPLAAVTTMVLLLAAPLFRSAADEPMPQQLVAAQVRSLMPGHLVDVPSSDQHTVKPWFSGKLDFSPPVVDLTAYGFPLAGGRLDYIDDRPVAVVVYHRQKHSINLFLWPCKNAKTSPEKLYTRQGYNMIHWTESGLTCWAVSDVNQPDLQAFVQHLRKPGYGYSYTPSGAPAGATNQRK